MSTPLPMTTGRRLALLLGVPLALALIAWTGLTEVAFGASHPFTARVAITGPAGYTYNSVGVKESDTVKGGERTAVWKTDYPVRFFNVVAGRWNVRLGHGTAIYYHPGHETNVGDRACV